MKFTKNAKREFDHVNKYLKRTKENKTEKRKTYLGRLMKLLSPHCNASLIDQTRLASSIVKKEEPPKGGFRNRRQCLRQVPTGTEFKDYLTRAAANVRISFILYYHII